MNDTEQLLYLNGLMEMGEPLVEPMTVDELAQQVTEEYRLDELDKEERSWGDDAFGPLGDYEIDNPAEAGWGLLVHADEKDAMKDGLQPLIEHRNGRLLLYEGEDVYEWKEKNNAVAINPAQFPYYVLIAGSPTKIPFDLQCELDVLQAVGRVHFDDPSAYAQYAESVIKYEKGSGPSPGKRAVFFAPHHDDPTALSSQELVKPIFEQLKESMSDGLEFSLLIDDQATKTRLLGSVAADASGQTPALLFSAGHGKGFGSSNPDQRYLQGSMVCQDRKPPLTRDKREGYVTGFDVADGFRLPGGIHFLFACYGAGTYATSDFARWVSKKKRANLVAKQGKEDFVAYLPKALLSAPDAAALAVVAHVDPALVIGIKSPVTGQARIQPFKEAIADLLQGKPVGYALMALNMSFSDKSVMMSGYAKRLLKSGHKLSKEERAKLARLWMLRNDAANYVIIGDPAARLNLA
jgi:hypothetical protein